MNKCAQQDCINGQLDAEFSCAARPPFKISRRSFIGAGCTGVAAYACTDPLASILGLSHSLAFADPAALEEAPVVTSDEKLAEAQAAYNKLEELQYNFDVAVADYAVAQSVLIAANSAVDKISAEISDTETEMLSLQDRLGSRARSMYRTGSISFLDILVGAATFRDFVCNWGILKDLNKEDADLVFQTKELRAVLDGQKKDLEHQQILARDAERSAAQSTIDAQALVHEMQGIYDQLSSEAQVLIVQEEEALQKELEEKRLQEARFIPAPNTNIDNTLEQDPPGEEIVARAREEIGKKYVWGACGPESFDCSGLASYCICGEYGKRLGVTYTMYYWTRVTEPKPGDICVNWEHCGVYIGINEETQKHRMIHAPNSLELVQEGDVKDDMIFVRFNKAQHKELFTSSQLDAYIYW